MFVTLVKIIIYWKLTCFSERCFEFPACVAIITVFQSVYPVCSNDIIIKALSSATIWLTPVRPSRRCSTMSKYFPFCVNVLVYFPTWTKWFHMKTLPFNPISPIYENKDYKIILLTLTKRKFYLTKSITSTYVAIKILL